MQMPAPNLLQRQQVFENLFLEISPLTVVMSDPGTNAMLGAQLTHTICTHFPLLSYRRMPLRLLQKIQLISAPAVDLLSMN